MIRAIATIPVPLRAQGRGRFAVPVLLLVLAGLLAPVLPAAAQSAAGLAQTGSGPAPSPALAEARPELAAMLDAMGIYDVLEIIADENVGGAGDLEAALFPGGGGEDWPALVARLHEPDRLAALFDASFPPEVLTPAQIAEIAAFVDSDLGRRIVAAEVETRARFLDPAAVDAANAAFRAARERGDPRLGILFELNAVNGFVERNVSGALNQRFAFYRGLAEGRALPGEMSEAMILDQVWSGETEVRAMTIEWLFSFQLAAYAGLSDAELQAYVAFCGTAAGQAVNAALFAAFDDMLAVLSHEMGTGAASFIAGREL